MLSFLLIFFRLGFVELQDDVDDVFIRLFCECLCWLCRCFSCAGIFSSPPGALSVPLPLPSSFDYRLYGLGVSLTVISSPSPICFVPVVVPMPLDFIFMSSLVTQASPILKGGIYKYACLCIFITVVLSNCPRYPWTARVRVDWVSFPVLYFGPRQNFVSATSLFSGCTFSRLVVETCIWRTAGRCCQNFASDRSRAGETNTIYSYSGGIRTHLYLLEIGFNP